jgi:hypothetical protein
MKKKLKLPVPVVEEPSPPSTFRESLDRFPIDLASSSLDAFHGEFDIENEMVPNLAVIEELESIRGMIENKSKDLQVRESSLSRSITKWNSEIVTAQGLVEELSANLVEVGEKRLKETFETYVVKLKALIVKLNERMAKSDAMRQKQQRFRGKSDVPPLPEIESGCTPILASVLAWISDNPQSTSRRVACASVLLVTSKSLSKGESKFVVNSIYNGLISHVRSKIHTTFLKSVDSEEISRTNHVPSSKFSQAKTTILKRQLGVLEGSTSTAIEIIVSDTSLGENRLVDVYAELDEHLKPLWEIGKAAFATHVRESFIRLWSDPSSQAGLVAALRLKSAGKGVRYSLIQLMMSTIDQRSVSESLRELTRILNESPKKFVPMLDGILSSLVFCLYKCSELDAQSCVTEEISHFVKVIVSTKCVHDHIGRLLSNSHQLLWFIFRRAFFPESKPLSPSIIDAYFSLINCADSLASLSPWKDSVIDAIQQRALGDKGVSLLKNLVKRF